MENNSVRKIAVLATFLGLGVLLNWVESLIPILIAVPGIKLGLANTMNIIILYFFGKKEYFALGGLRVLLVGILFTGIFSYRFIFSCLGFLVSAIVVLLMNLQKKFSIYSLSIASAVFHGIGQICGAVIMYTTPDGSSIYLFTYLPILVISGVITGILIAIIASLSIKRLEKLTIFKNI